MNHASLSFYYSAVHDYYPRIKRDFLFSSLMMIVIACVNVLSPYFMSASVNSITSSHIVHAEFFIYVALFGLSWSASHILEWVKNIVSASFLVKIEAAMHNTLFNKIVHAKESILTTVSSGQVIEEIGRGRILLASLVHTFFWGLFPLIIQIFFSYIFILKSVGFIFSLFFIIGLFLFFLTSFLLSRYSEIIHHRLMDAHNLVTSHLSERLTLLDDIKVNSSFDKEKKNIHALTQSYINIISSGNRKIGVYMVYQSLLLGFLLILFTCYVALLILQGTRPPGDYLLISGYIIQLTTPLIHVGGSFINIKKDVEALKRLRYFLNLDEINPATHIKFAEQSSIIFLAKNLDITINQKPIIRKLSFTISKGDMVAIAGVSGAGKTSLVQTMLGLNVLKPGQLYFKNRDVGTLATADIIAHCAIVRQQPVILTGSLRDNLTYGCNETIDDEILINIINLLHLNSMDDQVDGTRALNILLSPVSPLSGGEKQRIAIGRALARQKNILILDDPLQRWTRYYLST